jgi:hypothetical protein
MNDEYGGFIEDDEEDKRFWIGGPSEWVFDLLWCSGS